MEGQGSRVVRNELEKFIFLMKINCGGCGMNKKGVKPPQAGAGPPAQLPESQAGSPLIVKAGGESQQQCQEQPAQHWKRSVSGGKRCREPVLL